MLNPFFLQGSKSEQNLMQDLINESIKMYGIDVYYMPRKFLGEKNVIKENVVASFEDSLPIEAYVVSYDGWEGQQVELSKFGIQSKDEIILVISQERYETYIYPLIKNKSNLKLTTRPKEGDLIYFPLGDVLFEIKNVKRDKPWYQLQKNYVYELSCELFEFEDEIIDTGIDIIDDELIDLGYTATFNFVGSGTSATAITGPVKINSGLKNISMLSVGYGYIGIPSVLISPPQVGGGVTAKAVAITSRNNSNGKYYVDSVLIQNSGSGYITAPLILFSGGEDYETKVAIATCTVAQGTVGIITITSGGSNYVGIPTVTFSSPTGTGITALGSAVLQNGVVTEIRLTTAGAGYTSLPLILIEPPESYGISTIGVYNLNDVVTGSISGSTARVRKYKSDLLSLDVSNITGKFIAGEKIVGIGSTYLTLNYVNNYIDTTDNYNQNEEIQLESDDILDFDETNPFGGV